MIPPIVIKILGRDTLGSKLSNSQKQLRNFGKSVQRIGRTLTRSLTLPIVVSGGLMVKASTDFNAAMARVGTLIPGNLKRLNELKKGVQNLSIETGKSTSELADGLFAVISAFQDTNETMARLRVISRGAVGGITETSSAVKLASIITKNYGDISAKAVQKVLDLSLQTNVLGETTFPELAESMARTVPFAKTLMVTQKELFGAMATFTGVAGNTSEVVTQLRSFLGALLKPTADMTKAFRVLGVASGKELIQTKGLQGAMTALYKITKPYPGILGKVLGRKEALNIVLAASEGLADAFTFKTKAMSEALGLSELAFKEMTEGINKNGFAIKQLWRRVILLAQKFGDSLTPAIVKVIEKIKPMFKWLSELSNKTKGFILIILGITAALGPLTLAVATLGLVLQTVGWPITLIIGGVVLLAVAIAALVIWWDKIIDTVARFGWIIGLLTGPIGWFIYASALIIKHWDSIVGYLKDSWEWIKKLGTAIKNLDFGMIGKLFMSGTNVEYEKRQQAELNQRYGLTPAFNVNQNMQGKIDINVKAPPGTEVTAQSSEVSMDVTKQGLSFAGGVSG